MSRRRWYHYRTSITASYRLRPRRYGRGLDLIETINGEEKVHELTPTMLEHLRSPINANFWTREWMGNVTRCRFKEIGIVNNYWLHPEQALTPKGHEIRRLVISVCGPRNGQEPIFVPLHGPNHYSDDEA